MDANDYGKQIEREIEENAKKKFDGSGIEIRDAFSDITLVTGASCGFFGSMQGFRNSSRDRRVRVYYEVHWSQGGNNGVTSGNTIVGPGQTVWIVCSAGEGVGGGSRRLVKTGAHYE